jgi:cellulose synthase/poly-beta-1,6-N-acetylglucosamine synthase-like glycosyltransferase
LASSASQKKSVSQSALRAVSNHLDRLNIAGVTEQGVSPEKVIVKYSLIREPLVSIVIYPSEAAADIGENLNDIINSTAYDNYELLVITPEEAPLLKSLQGGSSSPKIKLLAAHTDEVQSLSSLKNDAIRQAKGEHIVFMRSDCIPVGKMWLEELLMLDQFADVGAVGAKIYYSDKKTILSAGKTVGDDSLPVNFYDGSDSSSNSGYYANASTARQCSILSGISLMIRKDALDLVGGFDEAFATALCDADLCLRLRDAGFKLLINPYAEVFVNAKPGEYDEERLDTLIALRREQKEFVTRRKTMLADGDPFYNRNFSRSQLWTDELLVEKSIENEKGW